MPASIGVNLRVTGNCRQGGRKYMEDCFSVAYQQTEDEKDLEYAFFGIYDGHGGVEAAVFAKEHLMETIIKHKNFWSDNDEDVLRAIKDGYIATHYAMWREQYKWPKTSSGLPSTAGTTASVAFIRRGKIYIGHVGDSGIILGYQEPGSQEWKAKQLTKDHKPENPEEMKRIESCGGKVVAKSGVPRVVWNRPKIGHQGPVRRSTLIDEIPFLAVARSLGDLWSYNSQIDQFVVSPDPDCSVLTIDTNVHRCLIFGTDGLFNMLTAAQAVHIVQQAERHNESEALSDDYNKVWLNPSKLLVEKALDRWHATKMRADNTSAVTLMLDPPGPPRAQVLKDRKKNLPASGLKIMTRYDTEASQQQPCHQENNLTSKSETDTPKDASPCSKPELPLVTPETVPQTTVLCEKSKKDAEPSDISTSSENISSNYPLKERNFIPKLRESTSFDPREPHRPSDVGKENNTLTPDDNSIQIHEISSSNIDETLHEEETNTTIVQNPDEGLTKKSSNKRKFENEDGQQHQQRKSLRLSSTQKTTEESKKPAPCTLAEEKLKRLAEAAEKLKLADAQPAVTNTTETVEDTKNETKETSLTQKILRSKQIGVKKKGLVKRPLNRRKLKVMLELIGNQARPKIFELNIQRPEILYSEVVEVDCRIIPTLEGKCELGDFAKHWRVVEGKTGEKFFVTKELDKEEVTKSLQELKSKGIDSISVALAHSYTYFEHEQKIGAIAKDLGFKHVSLSHDVIAMTRIVPRGFTSCADAYLTPHVKRYVEGFCKGFKSNLQGTRVLFMQSDGGLTPMQNFNGAKAILSGPAGGVVGYAVTTWQKETDLPVIGFDMGGTSTDVSRFAGTYEHVYESTTAGVTIQAPQLDINTVAAGGGSMLFFRSGMFVVGPESAGAHPGPVCYKKNGPLTVTDANLVLGRLLPEFFPKIFGPNEDSPLDKEGALAAFQSLTQDINAFLQSQDDKKSKMSVEEVAMGFIRVANEAMCRPIRALTQGKGYDTSRHALACFGGAGGQHACAIARSLGMTTVFVHKYAGILSAYGMALADVVQEAQESSAKTYSEENFNYFDSRFEALELQCRNELRYQGFTDSDIVLEPYLHMRYDGTDCALMCPPTHAESGDSVRPKHGDFLRSFIERYKSEFGFVIGQRNIVVDDIRVRGVGKSAVQQEVVVVESKEEPAPSEKVKVFFENQYFDTSVYELKDLKAGQILPGPSIIMDQLSTILVEPGCTALVTKFGDIKITIGSGKMKKIGPELDSIQLSIFSHRFMSIAEQMGRILQRTSISTNIKERLDFSCALFGEDGGLVSNAPHIPVHLGAMQEAVQYQMRARKTFNPGDVILANHPGAGGSHLPDFTVITPVFYRNRPEPIFFVASRGHHADIGGITPGSMPPHSTSLAQEGAAFKSFLLVQKDRFMEEEVTRAIKDAGGRNLHDNISDLRAQVAANKKGIDLVLELIDQYGLEVVQAYMRHIQTNAELAVRDMLREVARNAVARTGSARLHYLDHMDDGSPINLNVELDEKSGSAFCDFRGSGPEVWGNCNAPRAVTLSALIYCLRCMVGHDVPLNQGCLAPVKVEIPKGSLLDPSDEAAVVGGNVLTSQRIVDVVLGAFRACAASQGCMNNITFGNEFWGCYETVAGGSGAGPSWDGCSGVHAHMTNTRITDVEIVERRYPVHVKTFTLRPNTGGQGKYRGGDGVVRELMFRAPLTLSVLTERRALQPYGLEGGQPGARGLNLLIRADGRTINLGPKTAVAVQPGDTFRLHTPGGGGFGAKGTEAPPSDEGSSLKRSGKAFVERGSVYEYRMAQEGV